jgi:ABC transporter DrrB family efflux protein
MTTTLLPERTPSPAPAPAAAETVTGTGLTGWLRDTRILTRRNLAHIRREPMQLSDVTIQPVLFVLLFVYVFGGAMVVPGGGSYADYAIAGMLTLNLTTASVGTAVGLSTDLSTGMIDRFRTLPLFHSAVLVGRTLSDLLAATLAATLVGLTGLVVGWRPTTNPLSILAGFAIVLLFAFVMSWASACLGLTSQSPEAAQGIAFVIFFPLSFVSNAFVPTQGMPAWLATVANWNPVSAVTASCRELFGNPNPSAAIDTWPMQHPTWAALVWCIAILAVCAPLATRLYRRRTTD